MASKKHILLDVRLLGRGATSGIPEYTQNLVDAILAEPKSHTFTLFTSGIHRRPLPVRWLEHPETKTYSAYAPNRLLDLSVRLFNAPKIDTRISADVVFSPHFNSMALQKTPRVVTFHDLSFLHHPYFFSKKQRLWHWLQNYRKQAQEAHHIIAVSEFTKLDIVHRLNISPERVSVVYSGIHKRFSKLPEDTVREFKKKHDLHEPFLLYLGTLEPRKNIEAIIRAFTIIKKRPDCASLRLVVAGRPGWLYRNILREASRSPFSTHIRFWPDLNSQDRVPLYNAAHTFVFPSFFEGFGFPPLEAQACGTPVVAADRTSIPEILGSSAILVNPWSIHELADALSVMISNGSERERYIAKGKENARRFTWKRSAEETLTVLEHA